VQNLNANEYKIHTLDFPQAGANKNCDRLQESRSYMRQKTSLGQLSVAVYQADLSAAPGAE
jgi:hypothetical protein